MQNLCFRNVLNVKFPKIVAEKFAFYTFGRKVVESAGNDSEMALIKLSEIFNHSSPAITRRYLGLRQQELGEVYDGLEF